MRITILDATAADAAVIADFNARLARETESRELDPVRLAAGVARLLSEPAKGRYFLAEVPGGIAGQMMITCEWSDWRNGDFWWIQSVFVRPESRRQGVFRALFRHVERLARSGSDVCGLRLYMHAANESARATYLRLGMAESHYEFFEQDFVLGGDAPG